MTEQHELPFWTGKIQTIPKEWMDINGHMNMKYYFQVVEEALEATVVPELVRDPETSHTVKYWTSETEIFYKKEMFAGQTIIAHIYPIARNEFELEFLGKVMIPGEPMIESAACYLRGYLSNKGEGTTVDLTPDIKTLFDAKLALVDEAITKPVYPEPHVISHAADSWHKSAEGIASSNFTGDAADIGLAEHLDVFDAAAVGMFAELARQINIFSVPGMGGFVLSNYIEYNDKLRPGDAYHTRSRVHALRKKTVTFQHELYRDPGYDSHVASWRHTMTFIDMHKRKSIPVPELFLTTIEKYYNIQLPRMDVISD